ncbi:alkaline phosphatase family protein [Halalkalicoccus sp. NIPERK01]|uniref:alkaline phosphatase family protein n=1 Tax=Halalkalicoccus sp. NIPERK01 TaxID=3053469 RepID=UPI00256F523D|nr:alkaline phosphatase family protein [Halalkalicoccus sp. NIPERK01]MDL5361457.1 alkaline phosphatase family protein [Halalkalicoccus sp. NIPERK01]
MSTDRGGDVDTLLIGIDACSQGILEPLFEAERVPTIQSIWEAGPSGPLESQIPPWTASAWPSLYTGTNPGKHGVFDFLTYDGYDWGVANASAVDEHSLWELLDYHGKRSVVVNVPMTYPPSGIDGAVIPGFTAPENPPSHPEGILEEVREAIGEYKVYPTPGGEAEAFEEYVDSVRMRSDAFLYLADRFEPDFGFVQFQVTDTVFHQYGYEEDLVAEIYEAVDREIERILEATDPTVALLVSDHGLGKYEGSEFRLNTFLRNHGYIETTRSAAGMPSWQTVREQSLRKGEEKTEREPTLLERGVATAANFGMTTHRVARALERVGLDDLAKRHAPAGIVKASDEQVDFAESTAYMRSRVETGVRINLAGRDPEGVVPPAEYEDLREELIELLSDVRAPDGERVFEDVARVEEYFEGPNVERAVDVMTVPNDWNYFLSAQLREDLFAPPSEPWNHKLDGVVMATGPGIDADADLAGAHLLDVAPTVLSALGVPRSDRMDGEPLALVATSDETTYPDHERGVRETTADGDVEDRLADLGYLE